ncbi:hypothetical protein THOM_0882 [Trachipleistophora hominis]|uniref:Uncharacterized protein n=1 Tax=Trachipleistophora hominis TaxID=72359 RepID=L7JXH2_TRAHO|nr:hypothetical protein THOM_0882 [Trachipleistophora hominis]
MKWFCSKDREPKADQAMVGASVLGESFKVCGGKKL